VRRPLQSLMLAMIFKQYKIILKLGGDPSESSQASLEEACRIT